MDPRPTRALFKTLGAVAFVVLATANAAGYRYGVSDQAFYIPAFRRAIDSRAFPHDTPLIEAQARLMVLDEAVGALARASGLSLETICVLGYLASLLLIWTALVRIGAVLYVTQWGTIALLAAFTLRHQITRTSANSFEPYFHPRMLAFGAGALAVAAVLRGRSRVAFVLVALAGLVHATTALWFAILIGVALLVCDRTLRPWLIGASVLGAVAAAWAVTAGPLAGALVRIDPQWRQVLETKDTLFAHRWSAGAWLANLGTAAVWAWAYLERKRSGRVTPAETGLAAGGVVLCATFLITLPLAAAGIWLFVELQISRVFWLIDFMATVFALSAVEARWRDVRVIRGVAAAVIAFSIARGIYILEVEHPERGLFQLELPQSPWTDAMEWLSRTPSDSYVLADPAHAWKYGTSVRVSAGRGVFYEEVKDTAVAIYSREVAMRALERLRAARGFDRLTPEAAQTLARRYDLDYLVTTGRLDLPVAYRNDQFTIYRLDSTRR